MNITKTIRVVSLIVFTLLFSWVTSALCGTPPPRLDDSVMPRVAPPTVFQQVEKKCQAIENDENLPISCDFAATEKGAALVFVFPTVQDAQQYLPGLKTLMTDFCEEVRGKGMGGIVTFSYADVHMAQILDCRTGRMSSLIPWSVFEELPEN